MILPSFHVFLQLFGKNSSNKLELDYVFGKYLQVIFVLDLARA